MSYIKPRKDIMEKLTPEQLQVYLDDLERFRAVEKDYFNERINQSKMTSEQIKRRDTIDELRKKM